MAPFGHIKIKKFIENTDGTVTGELLTDGKYRIYYKEYCMESLTDNRIKIKPADGHGNEVTIQARIEINEKIIAFMGLYSGDGSKGTEDTSNPSIIKPSISFSQREPNLVKFAIDAFKMIDLPPILWTHS